MRARITFLLVALMLYGLGTVAPAGPTPGHPVRFTLERSTVEVGEQPKAIFDRTLPDVPGERYWITVAGASERDDVRGQWHYIDDGISNTTLKAPRSPGRFEVRLHDGYPRVESNVVHREALTVVPRGSAPPSTSATRSATSVKVSADAFLTLK